MNSRQLCYNYFVQLTTPKIRRSSCHIFQSIQSSPNGQQSNLLQNWIKSKKTLIISNANCTLILTNSMEQSPSWEANRFSVSQEIPAFYGTRRFIIAFTSAATCPYSQPDQSSSCIPNPISWRSILILSSHLSLGLPSGDLYTNEEIDTIWASNVNSFGISSDTFQNFPWVGYKSSARLSPGIRLPP